MSKQPAALKARSGRLLSSFFFFLTPIQFLAIYLIYLMIVLGGSQEEYAKEKEGLSGAGRAPRSEQSQAVLPHL